MPHQLVRHSFLSLEVDCKAEISKKDRVRYIIHITVSRRITGSILNSNLLSTKLFIPEPRQGYIMRPQIA